MRISRVRPAAPRVLLLVALVAAGTSCDREPRREVVIYCALDSVFSAQILDQFERDTGIDVRAVHDTEATKTTGLVERLRRERKQARCDVFWNNEILRTIRLATEGVLAPYDSPSARDIPTAFRDSEHRWTGFAARARALAYDPATVADSDVPRSHAELLDPRWRGRIVMANPEFGTTGSHLAVLFATWGEQRAREFLVGLARNDVVVVGGNATSRDRVVSGEALLGLTDTDDIEVVRRHGTSIGCGLYPDEGVILLPNTVALVAGAPNPPEARALIDYLLSTAVEARLAASPSRQIPLRAGVAVPEGGLRLADLHTFEVSYTAAAEALPVALAAARELLR